MTKWSDAARQNNSGFTLPLTEAQLDEWRRLPAHQQPVWEDSERAEECRRVLTESPGLVTAAEVAELLRVLSQCALGEVDIIQVGDCAEDPAGSAPDAVRRTMGLIEALAGMWQLTTGKPVVRVGRMAGQYAKPRSAPTEAVGGRPLAVYRGHMINRPEATETSRRHVPDHMLHCYRSAGRVLAELERLRTDPASQPRIWTSHEALVLDYELGLLRRDDSGRMLLTSTHWPWIGERTRQPDGAHVRLLASVINPVACKIGPSASPDDVLALCEALNPERETGRLTLITRMGEDRVSEALPPLVEATAAARHPVLWLCDPMHANTRLREGVKTRLMEAITSELQQFRRCVTESGGVAGGVHLEATATNVAECISEETGVELDRTRYTTLCDPRLNPDQALSVLAAAGRAASTDVPEPTSHRAWPPHDGGALPHADIPRK
ncbi:3-deoxy-7-phosphoheptulonate synthase [Streptomyces longwoodensis]|uniref:3-deoxy-7-phosphoheptulonate synthase n=1 Tax=Streptomyces longwoodensis TaxID=68231 RepID=UPI0033E127BE